MDYLVKNDFLNIISNKALNVLTESNDTLLDTSEAIAIEETKSYLSVRFDVQAIFEGDHSLVKMYLVDIAIYHLHARVSPDNIPELRKERYQYAKEWLMQVADGSIDPLLPNNESNKHPIRYGSNEKNQNFY